MLKKSLLISLFIFTLFSCVQTTANLKNENGEFVSRNGKITIHQDSIAKELFYPCLKYLADDLGTNIVHSSRTRLSMKGTLPKGYAVAIQLEQRLDNVCEIRIYSTRHGRPDDTLSNKVAAELIPKLQ